MQRASAREVLNKLMRWRSMLGQMVARWRRRRRIR
jgi:hypothetical protein